MKIENECLFRKCVMSIFPLTFSSTLPVATVYEQTRLCGRRHACVMYCILLGYGKRAYTIEWKITLNDDGLIGWC